MTLKNFFFIIGLPRTRSTWLANFLTYKTSFCFHEAIRLCYKIKDMQPLLESIEEQNVGDADTMLIQYKDQIIEMFPSAKWVIIKRDFEDVMLSLGKKFAFKNPEDDRVLFKEIEKKITSFEKEHPALIINYEDLNNAEICKKLWDYCISDSSFNYKRWMQLDVIKMDPFENKMLKYHGLDAKRTVGDYGIVR